MTRFFTLLLSLAMAMGANAAIKLNLTFTTSKQKQAPEIAWSTPAMVADLPNLQAENLKDEGVRTWMYDEADNAKRPTSARYCVTANYDLSSPTELAANGVVLQTTKGLKFKADDNKNNNVRIDPDNSRGLLIEVGCYLIIPDLKKGDIVQFGTRTGSNGNLRTWALTNGTVVSGSLSSSTGVFADVTFSVNEDGDVILTPDAFMSINYITVIGNSESQGGGTDPGDLKLTIWNYDQLKYVRDNPTNELYMSPYLQILSSAEGLLNSTPVSVMMKNKTAASGDKHDYLSQGRYWWPNPNTADGLPYIRKDGVSNDAEVNALDRNRLGDMASHVTTLSLAYFFSGEEKYAAKAVEQLKVWFLNADTKMNPNLNYGQIVPGQNNNLGRGEGVLDAYSFIEMLDAVPLLTGSEAYSSQVESDLKAWFSEFLNWLLTSSIAMEEKNANNNHGVCYDVQVAAYANFVGNTTVRDLLIANFWTNRINPQIQADGKQPKELERTLGYHYSQYNLEHIIDIFQIARNAGVEVGGNSAESFQKVAKAFDFLTPFLGQSVTAWNNAGYQQISGWDGAKKNLTRVLYRAWLLFPEYTNYETLYNQYGPTSEKDRYTILYIKENSATGISSLAPAASNNVEGDKYIYSLDGRVVTNSSNLPKGIYIIGGKKYVKK